MKKYLFSIIPFVLGILCLIIYNSIESKIAPDGTLVEPFGLIPIGMLLTAFGLIDGIIVSTWALFHNPAKADKRIFALLLTFTLLFVLYYSFFH